jgi:hypothetical protein
MIGYGKYAQEINPACLTVTVCTSLWDYTVIALPGMLAAKVIYKTDARERGSIPLSHISPAARGGWTHRQ